jgi:predicted metal-dependent hydrolase
MSVIIIPKSRNSSLSHQKPSSSSQNCLIQNHRFTYTVTQKSVKNITLTLISKRRFRVSCPRRTTQASIDKFIAQYSGWIYNHSRQLRPRRSLFKLSRLRILDTSYRLNFISASRDSVVLLPKDCSINVQSATTSQPHLKKLLEKYLIRHARALINQHLQELKAQYGFKYRRVSLRNQSSRFGSCSHLSNLNFNWQIIFLPTDKFRHILLHELTHLDIKNHSAAFWQQLSVYDPHCAINRRWVRRQASSHFLF